MTSLATLSSPALLARTHALVRRDRALEAELLAHLGEVDARRLYLDEGCSSMFRFCVRVLHLAEGVAYKRILAARAARRHPELLDAVREGALHVTGVALLAPHLGSGSIEKWISAARHRSAEEIKRLLADRAPRPDVRAAVRRLPGPAPGGVATPGTLPPANPEAGSPEGPEGENAGAPGRFGPDRRAGSDDGHSVEAPLPRPRTEPLGGERYAVQFTASGEVYAQLQELRALMRHQIPRATSPPRSGGPSRSETESGAPSSLRRAVAARRGRSSSSTTRTPGIGHGPTRWRVCGSAVVPTTNRRRSVSSERST